MFLWNGIRVTLYSQYPRKIRSVTTPYLGRGRTVQTRFYFISRDVYESIEYSGISRKIAIKIIMLDAIVAVSALSMLQNDFGKWNRVLYIACSCYKSRRTKNDFRYVRNEKNYLFTHWWHCLGFSKIRLTFVLLKYSYICKMIMIKAYARIQAARFGLFITLFKQRRYLD